MPQTSALKRYKESLYLNKEQKSTLVGSLLGDGTLRLGKDAINANFKVEQGLMHKDYVWWQYSIFENWVTTLPKLSFRYDDNRERYPKSWWFRTLRHPEITVYRKLFYPKGKKVVPVNISEMLNPMALAVWIMDDGSLSKNKLDISTYAFRLDEIKLLQEALKKNFSVKSRFYCDRNKGYRMYFSVYETKTVTKIIQPFVISSMSYKLPRTL